MKKISILILSITTLFAISGCEGDAIGGSGLDNNFAGFDVNYDIWDGWSEDAKNAVLEHEKADIIVDAMTSSYSYPGTPTLPDVDGSITYDAIKDSDEWPTNVKRVVSIIDEDDFNETLMYKNQYSKFWMDGTEHYTYRGFLTAVSKWPRYCDDKGANATETVDELCRKALATTFAHFTQETGSGEQLSNNPEVWKHGLYFFGENGYFGRWTQGQADPYCHENTETWSAVFPCSDMGHYGRGAKQISWNYNYARFSLAMYGDLRLLNDPTLIETTEFLGFASAIWFYMTPTSGKPSMHDVVTKRWVPTSDDKSKGLDYGLGITTNIINGGIECGANLAGYYPSNTWGDTNREYYYTKWAEKFGISNLISGEVNVCANQVQIGYDGLEDYQFPMYWQYENGTIVPWPEETGYQLFVIQCYDALLESKNNWRYPERYYTN